MTTPNEPGNDPLDHTTHIPRPDLSGQPPAGAPSQPPAGGDAPKPPQPSWNPPPQQPSYQQPGQPGGYQPAGSHQGQGPGQHSGAGQTTGGHQQPWSSRPDPTAPAPGTSGVPAADLDAYDVGGPDDSGFLAGLTDFKFTNLISLRVIPILYAISLVVITVSAVIGALGAIISGFATGGAAIFGGLIAGLIIIPIFWFLYVIFTRVLYELFISIFKIAKNSDKIANNTAK